MPDALQRLERALSEGYYAAGFLSYELGLTLESKLAPLLPPTRPTPLIWLGIFKAPSLLTGPHTDDILRAQMRRGHRIQSPQPALDRAAYMAKIQQIKDYIAAGDVYQVNYTFPLHFQMWGDPASLYAAMRTRQPVAYGGLIQTGDAALLSVSPELFVTSTGGILEARPMKGTVHRSPLPDEDKRLAAWLTQDTKSRAENLMIVDLLRNDLSRIADAGSVRVPSLFSVETYAAFHTMTTRITARKRAGSTVGDAIRALFPCGSVTGAPKIRAMEIIQELEAVPRGPYTGAMGFIAPNGDFRFNVAIRTALIDGSGAGTLGIGSGIVWDSDPSAEYDECLLKAEFLTGDCAPFGLIETLAWTRAQGFAHMEGHINRLRASAEWFGFAYDETVFRNTLDRLVTNAPTDSLRIRIVLRPDGSVESSAAPLPPVAERLTYVISEHRLDAAHPYLRFKTTRRALYDREHADYSARIGCDEVLYLNINGELAEGSRTNIFIEKDGMLYTPPLASGALDGVLRRHLLNDPHTRIEERVLTLDDLETADTVFLGNAVRGLIPAVHHEQLAPRSSARLAKT